MPAVTGVIDEEPIAIGQLAADGVKPSAEARAARSAPEVGNRVRSVLGGQSMLRVEDFREQLIDARRRELGVLELQVARPAASVTEEDLMRQISQPSGAQEALEV